MNTFDVYPLFNIVPDYAQGSYIFDEAGQRYLDMYGGHAVISIGHSHPHYLARMTRQLNKMGFYSNSVIIPAQRKLAEILGKISNYEDYSLFLCNSGAEANENAFKLASFHTGKKKIVAFKESFHGRTSAAVAATDDASISAPINKSENFVFCEWNNAEMLQNLLAAGDVAAVIIEGIQGVGGVKVAEDFFLKKIAGLCAASGALFIADEIQSGCGRTGLYFAHQHAAVRPHLITMAKGIGNGFPVAGVMICPEIKAKHGLLGTTFGGSHLACEAAIAVAETIENEKLMQNAAEKGTWLIKEISRMKGVKQVRGRGLMIGVDLEAPLKKIRTELLERHKVFTGASPKTNTLRILPSLAITREECKIFTEALRASLHVNEPVLNAEQ